MKKWPSFGYFAPNDVAHGIVLRSCHFPFFLFCGIIVAVFYPCELFVKKAGRKNAPRTLG